MILISDLIGHPSSPRNIYSNLNALAERRDLYEGEDFWFGFDSSNKNFLDIIGGQQPLAIKHGPILSLYQRSVEGEECRTYYIDVAAKKLHPIIRIQASTSQIHDLRALLPWSFRDTYLPSPEQVKTDLSVDVRKPGQLIESALELLANNQWPDDGLINQLPDLASKVEKEYELNIELADLSALKQRVSPKKEKASATHFIAPYNPFFDNERLNIDFIQAQNPDQITVRSIGGKYPRIEIITPGVHESLEYQGVFARTKPELYSLLKESLDNPETLATLLEEHFTNVINSYLEAHSFEKEVSPQIKQIGPA